RPETRLRALRAAAFHLRAPWERGGRAHAVRGARPRGGHAQHADARADAHARARADRPPATAGTWPAHQAALRAPGRPQSATYRDPRQPDSLGTRGLHTLSRQRVP